MTPNIINAKRPVLVMRKRQQNAESAESASLWPDLSSLEGRAAAALALTTIGKSSIPVQMAGLVGEVTLIQYTLLVLLALYIAFRGGGIRIAAALLPLSALVSTALSAHPAAALPRWAGWLLIYAICAPLFCGRFAQSFRRQLWTSLTSISVVITLCSLPLYLVPILPRGRGFFTGLMGHSMLMAPIAGIAVAVLFARYLSTNQKMYFRTFLAAMAVLILCGSRAALLGCFCSCGFFMIIANKETRRRVLPILLLLFTVAAGAYSLRSALSATDVGKYYFVTKGTRNTRSELWQSRLEEARESPLLGLGIGMSAAAADQRVADAAVSPDMRIEPGSSWIAMLSMTGLSGAMAFLLMVAATLKRVNGYRNRITNSAADEVKGCLVFFVVHATFEGYIFAVGAPLAVVFWLCWGRLDDVYRPKTSSAIRELRAV